MQNFGLESRARRGLLRGVRNKMAAGEESDTEDAKTRPLRPRPVALVLLFDPHFNLDPFRKANSCIFEGFLRGMAYPKIADLRTGR